MTPPTVAEFVALKGFFRLERGSRAVSLTESVEAWSAGARPDGAEHTVRWGHGSTCEAAIADWWARAGVPS